MNRRLCLLLVTLPSALGADLTGTVRGRLLPELDADARAAILGEVVRAADPEELRLVAEAIRVRDSLSAHAVKDPAVVARYVDAALSSDASVRSLAARGAAWGGRLTAAGAIDAPSDAQLAAWSAVRLDLAPVVWAVRTDEEGSRWAALTSVSRDEATVDPQVSGYEGPNFGGPGFPIAGWTVTRAGERLADGRTTDALLHPPGAACPDQSITLAYEVTGERKATLVAAAVLAPGGGRSGPAMLVECGATGAPDRPAATGNVPRLRWPCAPDALDPAAYRPVVVAVPARPDACLTRDDASGLVARANTAALASLGMERFRLPPANLPEVTLPTVEDPSLDPASFAEPD